MANTFQVSYPILSSNLVLCFKTDNDILFDINNYYFRIASYLVTQMVLDFLIIQEFFRQKKNCFA